MKAIARLARRPAATRGFSQEKPLGVIQQMKEYQEALQFAVDKKYPESLSRLQEAL